MNKNQTTPILIALSSLVFTTWCATTALGDAPSLSQIPTLVITNVPDTANEGRAITPDGQYVVGISSGSSLGGGSQDGQRGFLYPVGAASAINVLSSDNAQASVANGVGYRTALDPVYATNRTEIIISGMSSGYVTEWMTADGGVTFGPKRRNISFTYNVIGTVNQLGARLGSDAYFVSSHKNQSGEYVYLNAGSNTWVATMYYSRKGIPSGDKGETMNGVSASGRGVGSRLNGGIRKNYLLTFGIGSTDPDTPGVTPTPASAYFNGLAGTQEGTAFAVSADGNTVFGRSPIVGGAADLYGYKTTFSSTPLTDNATTQGPVDALPEFSDVGGSTSRSVPYGCTADGKYAVGMQYRGQERAVVWDTSSADTNIWTVLDLTDLARNNGFLGDFTLNLRRAFSAGTNGAGDVVITGRGIDSSVATRAFVMTVPQWIAAIQFPVNLTTNYGADATFSLKTNGTDSLTYQWYKDGSPLSGETTTGLTLASVSCAGGEAGDYSIVVSNMAISEVVTGAMTLTVLDPYITTQPSPSVQTNDEGTTVIYTVVADGAPTLSYQWQRNGVDLADGPTGWGSTIAGATTDTLTISNVQTGDGTNSPGSGLYSVVVTTSAGGCSVSSQEVILAVTPALPPPVLTSIEWYFGAPRLNVTGPIGQTFQVLYSTDVSLPLTNWTPLVTNTFSGGADVYDDFSFDPQQGFYRLVSP